MAQKVIIVGSGDQAKVLFHEIIHDKNINILGFIDENNKINKTIINFKKKDIKF